MKLYYSPTNCSAACFIAAHYSGLPIDCEQVDLREHKTLSGTNFFSVNPKGSVPCLILDDGTVLNEGPAILQYIADKVCNISMY